MLVAWLIFARSVQIAASISARGNLCVRGSRARPGPRGRERRLERARTAILTAGPLESARGSPFRSALVFAGSYEHERVVVCEGVFRHSVVDSVV